MLAESYLRTRARIALYVTCAFLLLFMAVQNVRYGLYDLFYMSILLAPIMLIGAVYAWSRRSDLGAHRGHLCVLAFMLVVIVIQLGLGETAISHWLYGLGLFSFLLLPLKKAFVFNIATLVCSSLALSLNESFYTTLRFATSYSLLVGLAGMYAYLYHHKSRFLVEVSIKDPTTGAYNLKHLDFTLKQEISRSESTAHPLSIILLEIDFFDQQLEVHGPNFANELLAAFGQRLLQATRAGDSIYHAERGRFYILLPVTPEEGLLVIAERLRRSVEEQTWPVVDKLNISVGCLTRSAGEVDDKLLLERAQGALKQAQKSGRNKVILSKR
ncbi:GGDEF domain-containing protein [Hahella ganghwensis]|uniref:GGDEF domain-containing protein n=1 Tax=Hahella ganghwensis TaxID=286420 RepID=UPI000363717E|nr:GGDEF domain-containing protein [Hahella ganghwensis]